MKTTGMFLVAASALVLAACAQSTTPDAADTQVAEPAVETNAVDAEQPTGEAASTDMADSDMPELCEGFGPQTPRDIADPTGTNTVMFPMAPAPAELNLCNIHSHTHAEHKAPGFSVKATDSYGGYRCNETEDLTDAELTPIAGDPAFGNVKPGDTIEVHWVYSSCDVSPGEGLGSCLTETCTDPLLRVEAQAFLLVNDPDALDFRDFAYGETVRDGRHQPMSLPAGTGDPVVFRGSTTGPSYTQQECSPLQVTWSVRPQCAKLDINSLHAWAADGNVFNETDSHGVRDLVTAPPLLSQIEAVE